MGNILHIAHTIQPRSNKYVQTCTLWVESMSHWIHSCLGNTSTSKVVVVQTRCKANINHLTYNEPLWGHQYNAFIFNCTLTSLLHIGTTNGTSQEELNI